MGSTGRTDDISGKTTEYEAATARWIERTVDFLMVESDRLYAQLRPEQIDGLGEMAVRSGVGGEVLVKPVHIVATGSIDVGSVIAGDFGDLETVVAEIAVSATAFPHASYPAACARLAEILGLFGLLAEGPAVDAGLTGLPAARISGTVADLLEHQPGCHHLISDGFAVSLIAPVLGPPGTTRRSLAIASRVAGR